MAASLKIKYFVPFDQLMGKTEELPLEGSLRLEDLIGLLAKKYKGLAESNLFDKLIILCNGEICSKESRVGEGDVISILAPLIGG